MRHLSEVDAERLLFPRDRPEREGVREGPTAEQVDDANLPPSAAGEAGRGVDDANLPPALRPGGPHRAPAPWKDSALEVLPGGTADVHRAPAPWKEGAPEVLPDGNPTDTRRLSRALRPHPFLEGHAGERLGGRFPRRHVPPPVLEDLGADAFQDEGGGKILQDPEDTRGASRLSADVGPEVRP